MTFVIRRVFHGKVGLGDQLIEQLQKGNILARAQGVAIIPRLLSDQDSGRTNRVAMEWEANSLEELDAVEQEIWVYPEAPELFKEFFDKLIELVDHAEVEVWSVR